jgi:hypothetical protein
MPSINGCHDIQRLASQIEEAAGCLLGGTHVEETRAEKIVQSASEIVVDGLAQGFVSPVELVGYAIGVRQLRPGPAAQVRGLFTASGSSSSGRARCVPGRRR